jgi:hypothetical protein
VLVVPSFSAALDVRGRHYQEHLPKSEQEGATSSFLPFSRSWLLKAGATQGCTFLIRNRKELGRSRGPLLPPVLGPFEREGTTQWLHPRWEQEGAGCWSFLPFSRIWPSREGAIQSLFPETKQVGAGCWSFLPFALSWPFREGATHGGVPS